MALTCKDNDCLGEALICPYCGYCQSCHHNSINYDDSCACNLAYKEDGRFRYEQDSSGNLPATVYCKLCGGNTWVVGCGSYFTAIKCVECKYEIEIHEG